MIQWLIKHHIILGLLLEFLILISIWFEGIISLWHLLISMTSTKINRDYFEHVKSKYKRYKHKSLHDKVREL